ncbi:MAG: hypothetical protein Q9168_000050 [Polycauliona sp. 1 TL-2023]
MSAANQETDDPTNAPLSTKNKVLETGALLAQCLIYDTPQPNARLIGVEYMITPKLYATLDTSERQLWHSHVFEVKSGMLIMPGLDLEEEMEQVIGLYGKTYHFWQVDRGDKLPLGKPELMGSFTSQEQLPEGLLAERDERYGISSKQKQEKRAYIEEPEVHNDADIAWKK